MLIAVNAGSSCDKSTSHRSCADSTAESIRYKGLNYHELVRGHQGGCGNSAAS